MKRLIKFAKIFFANKWKEISWAFTTEVAKGIYIALGVVIGCVCVVTPLCVFVQYCFSGIESFKTPGDIFFLYAAQVLGVVYAIALFGLFCYWIIKNIIVAWRDSK